MQQQEKIQKLLKNLVNYVIIFFQAFFILLKKIFVCF